MEIKSIVNEDNLISILLDDRSICELTRYSFEKGNPYNIDNSDSDIFFFNRLKVNKYKEGRGSFLMSTLVKILDERRIAVLNPVNPYGPMDLPQLLKFYKKFGFEVKYLEAGMYRKPQ